MFSSLAPELVQQMLDWFREQDRNVYKTAVATLAGQRKLRPVFIERKPLKEQYAWIHKTLQLKLCNGVAEHLLQAWLMGGQQEMLASFCDAMGIEHENGTVNGELPDTLDAGKLDQAVDKLVEAHNPQLVALYLQCFNLQMAGGWPTLSAKLENDERLKLA